MAKQLNLTSQGFNFLKIKAYYENLEGIVSHQDILYAYIVIF